MKRLIPICIIALFLFPWGLKGQLTLTLDPVTFLMDGPNDQTDITHYVHITNTSTQIANLLWSKRVTGQPSTWLTWVCDGNLCYTPDINSCPLGKPNVIMPGDTVEWSLHLNPRLTDGKANYDLTITDMDGNPLLTIDGEACIPECSTVGTKDLTDAKLTVYPNPTSDFFQVSGLQGVKYLEVFNIVGSKIRAFEAVPQRQYYVGDLNEGMYLVRLMDSSKKIIKTVRLSVR